MTKHPSRKVMNFRHLLGCDTIVWACRAKPEYPDRIQTQDQPIFFQNLQSFADCSTKMSIKYNFWIDLDSIHNKLSSDYSLNICFSCRLPCTNGQSFYQYKPPTGGGHLNLVCTGVCGHAKWKIDTSAD